MTTKHIILSKYKQHTLSIILVSVAIRLIGEDQPLLEGAILRQIQTAEITYNLFSDGFDLLHPKIHVLPEPRYFILEFPIYSGIIALLYKLFGVHEIFGRLISISAFAGSAWFVWLISSRRFNESIGRAAFFPLSIIFSRAFQPDPLALFLSLGAFFYFTEWLHGNKRAFLRTCTFAILAFLSKQTFAFMLLPMCLYALHREGLSALKNQKLILFVAIAFIPALCWTWHVKQVYLQIPIYNSANLNLKNWFIPAYFLEYVFYKTIFQWLTGIILTPLGFSLFLTGIFVKYDSDGDRLILFWLFGIVVFDVLFPLHAFTHEYYHLPLLPPASIMAAKAWWYFFEREKSYSGFHLKLFKWVILTIFLFSVLGYANSAYRLPSSVKNFKQNVKFLNEKTKDEDHIVVTNRYYLYYCNNKGWVFHSRKSHFQEVLDHYEKNKNLIPDSINYIETLRRQGAKYFFITRLDIYKNNSLLMNYLQNHYPIASKIEGVNVLFDLTTQLS